MGSFLPEHDSVRFAAIETSTDWCSVALWRDGEISAIEREAGQRHAELVLPMLERLLERARLGVEGLDAVAFGTGPGSFTGLRIACGIAQGLAFARGLPVIGVSTLEAIAEESGASRALVCLDARMHEVYYAGFERCEGIWRETIAAACVAPGRVERPAGGGWTGCGNGFAAYGEALCAALGGTLATVLPGIRPSAAALARLAAVPLAAGRGRDAALAAPVYVRDKVALTSAERANR
ncbi:MAG: tRNA (adenosine(37)-N6)-threonylcarbamoyltransferase complex dimerization subunit type 1 TsaB [Betaproteobacteria bacterium]|nr:tRNA (adenosine(37)-N6)-threonylcarbamoyltransferase complex dimerization subunit type 1 TsaB [Betaproteobacteria bacterium]